MPRFAPFAAVLQVGVAVSIAAAAAIAQARELPRTVAESSSYAKTSTAVDVARFVDACVELPQGDRLAVRVAGKTHGGHAQLLVTVALPPVPDERRLTALIIADIHGGEVEGKEAVQELLREFALGEHEDVLQHCDVAFVPIYNVDGNEAMADGHRPGQNGPFPVGARPNGQGLDLNRDFVKVDAKETRTLLRLFRELDPHLFVDLHTTNGSYHGYHLTHAPSLSPNVDPTIAALNRAVIADATRALEPQGFFTFDYGNFETRDWDGGGAPESPEGQRGWFTYDHRARYGVNYFGLRNRPAVLVEAYSYCDFATRIAVTKAFVLEVLRSVVARRDAVFAAAASADRRCATPAAPVWFGSATTFAPAERLPLRTGSVDRVDGEGERPVVFQRRDETGREEVDVVRAFRAERWRRLPRAWAIVAPSPEVLDRLHAHGIDFAAVDGEHQVLAQRFRVDQKKKPKRPYQGHQELVLGGAWLPAEKTTLPRGTIVIPARQRLARLAATLLEPDSEDSLSTWNFFESATEQHYPVLRLVD